MRVRTVRHGRLRARARFFFVRARMCTDLYQNFFGGPLLYHKLKFQIS